MSNQFMPDASPEERLQALINNADKVEETTYYKPLTEDELNEKREIIADNEIKLSDIAEEKKSVMQEFKDRTEPLTTQKQTILQEIRTKQVEVFGNVYHMVNYESGMMETFDKHGLLISSRRLKANEMQKNAFREGGKLRIAN